MMHVAGPKDANIILVIDDQMENIKMVVETLAAANYLTVVARSGEEGLRRAKFSHPSLILLDVRMPGLDGFETCLRLQADPATQAIPIIFMTMADDIKDKVQGFACGAVDYITKPVQIEELLARIRTHLTIRVLQHELELQNAQLERRVQERTADLEAEIEQRKRREQEQLHLMGTLRNQSEQLRLLSHTLAQQNSTRQEELAQLLQEQVFEHLERLESRLKFLRQLQSHKESGDAEISKGVAYIEESLTLLKISKTKLQQLQQRFAASPNEDKVDPLLKLSGREREVAHLIVAGKTSPEIADLLHLSVHTIRTYRQRLMKKLEVENAQALIKLLMDYAE